MTDDPRISEEARQRSRKTGLRLAAERTQYLRESASPRWERLRNVLQGHGVEVEDAAIAALFSDDTFQLFGRIYVRGGRMFTFDFDYRHNGASDIEDAHVVNFREQTEEYKCIFSEEVEFGLAVLNDWES